VQLKKSVDRKAEKMGSSSAFKKIGYLLCIINLVYHITLMLYLWAMEPLIEKSTERRFRRYMTDNHTAILVYFASALISKRVITKNIVRHYYYFTSQNKITFFREWFMMKALAQLVSIYIFYKLYQHAKISQQFFIPYGFLSSHIGEYQYHKIKLKYF
jgi:hypothetical protein